MPKLLIWCGLYRSLVTIALNFTILISVGHNVIIGINLLGDLTAIDYHDKIEPLLVIKGIVPKFDVADIGANEIDRCVIKLINHEIVLST